MTKIHSDIVRSFGHTAGTPIADAQVRGAPAPRGRATPNLSRLRARARGFRGGVRQGGSGGWGLSERGLQQTTHVPSTTNASHRTYIMLIYLNAGYATIERYEPSKTKRVHTQMAMRSSAHHRA
jgi:hypothetical protein